MGEQSGIYRRDGQKSGSYRRDEQVGSRLVSFTDPLASESRKYEQRGAVILHSATFPAYGAAKL